MSKISIPSKTIKMVKDSIALDHKEIWDDSALVDSWNQALEEYKVSFCYY